VIGSSQHTGIQFYSCLLKRRKHLI
jgi:hypothetical protein